MSETFEGSIPAVSGKMPTPANVVRARTEQSITEVTPDDSGVYRSKDQMSQTPQERISEVKSKIEETRGLSVPEEPAPDMLYAQVGPSGETQFVPPVTEPAASARPAQPETPTQEPASANRTVGLSRAEQMQQGLERMRQRRQR